MEKISEFKRVINQKSFTSDEVMGMAEGLASELKAISSSKMRQYFDDIKGLRRIIESGGSEELVKIKLHILRSRIFYDLKRDSKLGGLKEILEASIDVLMKNSQLNEKTKELSIFFESLYGYHYFHTYK